MSLSLGAIFLKEWPKRSAVYVCIIALIGAMLMLWNPKQGIPWPRDMVDWLAISSGISFAIMNVLIRDLQQVPVVSKAFVSWFGVALVAFLWLVVDYFSFTLHILLI